MTQSGAAAGSLKITVTLAKPTVDTQLVTVTAVTPLGERVTDISFYAATGTTYAVTDNGNGTFTVARPANVVGGSGDAVYTIVARATGYNSVSQQVTIAQQAAVPASAPQLTPSLAAGPVNYTFTYVVVGASYGYAMDGVAVGPVPASPWSIARDTVDHEYETTVIGEDGTSFPYNFTVPAAPQTDPGAPTGTPTAGGVGFASNAEFNAAVSLLAQLRVIAVKHGDMA